MIVGTPSERPVILPFRFFDREIVDAGVSMMHDAVLIELPVFVAIGAKPVTGIVVMLVGETDGDACSVESPELLDETVFEFTTPLSSQELDDLFASVDKLCAVSPFAIDCIGECDFFRIPRVPTVFGLSYFRGCGFTRKWGDQAWLWLRAQFLLLNSWILDC